MSAASSKESPRGVHRRNRLLGTFGARPFPKPFLRFILQVSPPFCSASESRTRLVRWKSPGGNDWQLAGLPGLTSWVRGVSDLGCSANRLWGEAAIFKALKTRVTEGLPFSEWTPRVMVFFGTRLHFIPSKRSVWMKGPSASRRLFLAAFGWITGISSA